MPQSRWRWTSERRLTREEKRKAHGHQTPPVFQRALAHAVKEQCLSECWFGRDLCLRSSLRDRLPLLLPATRMCEIGQRTPRQPISPFPGRPQGGSSPSLRTRTRLCHRSFTSTTSVASTVTHHDRKSIATLGTTVAFVAAIRCVAVPELPPPVGAPALDARVVLRPAASLNIYPRDGAGYLQGAYQRPVSFP